jgi:hypothetical protein
MRECDAIILKRHVAANALVDSRRGDFFKMRKETIDFSIFPWHNKDAPKKKSVIKIVLMRADPNSDGTTGAPHTSCAAVTKKKKKKQTKPSR